MIINDLNITGKPVYNETLELILIIIIANSYIVHLITERNTNALNKTKGN